MDLFGIIRIAWKSLWRHRRRTLITVVSIMLGLAAAVFFMTLAEGAYSQLVDDAVRMQAGHVTLEHESYRTAPAIDLRIAAAPALRERIEALPRVESTKALIQGQGVARSGAGAVGVAVMGVEPSVERRSSPFARKIVTGEYLDDADERKVVIGRDLAERLNLEIGKKLVLSSNDVHGNLVEELFRVKGIFATGAEEIDGYFVQAPIDSLRRLFGYAADEATQLGVVLSDPDRVKEAVKDVRALPLPAAAVVLPWEEVLPELAGYIRVDRVSNGVFYWLLLAIVLFTIFNTILMSVIERDREWAVLLAIGTKPAQVRLQVFFESVFIAALGCVLGIALGGAISYYVKIHGWDLTSLYDETMTVSGFAFDMVMRCKVSPQTLLAVAWKLFLVICVLSLVPMRRAARVGITDTLR